METNDFPLSFLCNFADNFVKSENSKLWECKWLEIIKSDFSKKLLKNSLDSEATNVENEDSMLEIGIAFLMAFVEANFIGPKNSNSVDYQDFSDQFVSNELKDTGKLVRDSEEINTNVKFPEFLIISYQIFEKLKTLKANSLILNWWIIRLLITHQKILDELANTIYENFLEIVKKLEDLCDDWKTENQEYKFLLKIEIAQGFLQFQRVQKCNEILENVCKKFNIEMNVEGLMGIRTKFQQKPVSQLCFKVIHENYDFPSAKLTNGNTDLPKLLKLDDDVRLERIKFLNESDNDTITLTSAMQALLITKLKYLLRSQPKDILASEELKPYITSLLYQTEGPLSVRLTALLLNIEEESSHQRTIERCLKQSEEILNLVTTDAKYSLFERFSYYFVSSLPAKWDIEKQLGDLMTSLGFVKTALDLYLRIQAWEEVIYCYNRLELRHKAAEIIQAELEKKPSAKLYCLLGDATDDPNLYEIAWKYSNYTSGKAQKHWGNFYFAKKDYETALPHLQKTIEINPLQESQLLRLGYAAISLEKWDLAVSAYIKYTHLEPNGFEAWNNLAKALIKIGDKKRAHKILNESLKCNFGNWKVWENFMVVSVDTGNFEDALNSYNRLIELKDKFYDLEVLKIVVNAIDQDMLDADGRPSSKLRKKATNILGHQCIKYPNEWQLWELTARLDETSMGRSQKLQKCLRAYQLSERNWMNVKETAQKCLKICLSLCEESLNAIGDHQDDEKSSINSVLSSARLSTQACLRVMDKQRDIEKWDESEQLYHTLSQLLVNLTEELQKRMTSN